MILNASFNILRCIALKVNENFKEESNSLVSSTPYLTFITPPALHIRSAFTLSCPRVANLGDGAIGMTATSCKEKGDL